MAASLTALLLTVSLLLCPFRCMGQQRGQTAASPSAPTCHCCHHEPPQEPSGQPLPVPQEDQHGCDNCVCHGATHSRDDMQLAGPVLDWLVAFVQVELTLPSPEQEVYAFSRDQPRHADAPTGLKVRILHQSFLL